MKTTCICPFGKKTYSTYLTKTQSFHLCLPNLALFSKSLKIYTFHRKTLSRQWHQNFPTSEMAFPWSWSVTNSKRKSFVSDLAESGTYWMEPKVVNKLFQSRTSGLFTKWRKCYEIHWFRIFFCFRFERKKISCTWDESPKKNRWNWNIQFFEQKTKGKAWLSRETRRKTERHACFSSSSHLGKNGGVAYCWTSKYILQTDLGKLILFMSGFPSPSLSFSLFNGRGLKSKEFSHIGSSAIGNCPFPHPKRRSSSFPMGMAAWLVVAELFWWMSI